MPAALKGMSWVNSPAADSGLVLGSWPAASEGACGAVLAVLIGAPAARRLASSAALVAGESSRPATWASWPGGSPAAMADACCSASACGRQERQHTMLMS